MISLPQLTPELQAHCHDLRTGRDNVVGEGVDERILVIDQQHPPAAADDKTP